MADEVTSTLCCAREYVASVAAIALAAHDVSALSRSAPVAAKRDVASATQGVNPCVPNAGRTGNWPARWSRRRSGAEMRMYVLIAWNQCVCVCMCV